MDEYEARRATVVLLSAFVVLAVALGAMVAKGDDDKDDERADVDTEQETTSTTARPTSTSDGSASSSSSSSVAASGGSSTSVARGSTTTTKPKPSTTTTVGRDELAEPGCASGGGGAPEGPGADWATRWQTKPQPNDPATITICIDDITPKVGQVVTLTLVGDDPDAVITEAECGWVIDWEGNLASLCRDVLVPTVAPRPTRRDSGPRADPRDPRLRDPGSAQGRRQRDLRGVARLPRRLQQLRRHPAHRGRPRLSRTPDERTPAPLSRLTGRWLWRRA